MENNENIEKDELLENIKNLEKKSNRLVDDKKRKKKRKKEKNQKKQGKFRISKKKVLITLAIILLAIILIVGIVAGTYIYKADGDITTAALNIAADVLGEDDPIFVLVLGISEDIKPALTDTIILAGYNPDSQKAFMVSIPRDTFVGTNEAWASGYDKINALYQKGKDGKKPGAEKTVAAVEKITGIDIDHYVIVRNSALPSIVNAIGEVEFDVPIDMDYDDPTQNLHIHLNAGVQMINGDKAEQLLRFRHNNDGTSYPMEYGDNDYGRMRTQREFIKAVASQLIGGNSSAKLTEIAKAVFNNITTDISLTKIIGYAPSAIKLDVNTVRMEQLPGYSEKINNLWFYRHDNIKTYDLINELLAELALDEKEMKDIYTPTSRVKNKRIPQNTTTQNQVETNTSAAEGTVVMCTHINVTKKTNRKATCTEAGEEIITCNDCGNVETRKIPATDHEISTTTTTLNGVTTIIETCKNEDCDYYKEKTQTNTDKENGTESEDKEDSGKEDNTQGDTTEKPKDEPEKEETPKEPTPAPTPTPTPPSLPVVSP